MIHIDTKAHNKYSSQTSLHMDTKLQNPKTLALNEDVVVRFSDNLIVVER